MIIRIVKMTFREDSTESFQQLFDSTSSRIRNFPGCNHLELLRDLRHPNIFFTYSYWDSTEDLDKYRNSALFKSVWEKTSVLFSEKASAWSVDRIRDIQ